MPQTVEVIQHARAAQVPLIKALLRLYEYAVVKAQVPLIKALLRLY
jgi:translation initiation factor IF-2